MISFGRRDGGRNLMVGVTGGTISYGIRKRQGTTVLLLQSLR